MKICPNCGAENDDNALTCILCEFDFENENSKTGATTNNENVVPDTDSVDKPSGKDDNMAPKSSNKPILIAIASVLAVCLGVGGVFLMMNKDDKKSDSSSNNTTIAVTSDAPTTEEAASTQENTTEAIATTTEQSTETTTTTTTVETTTAPAETTTQPQENSIKAFPATEISNYPQYVQAIKDGINNGYYTASSASYALYDLNKDGTPEMIINTAPYGIYAMDGNNCVEIQSTFKATRSPSLSITEKGFVKLSFVDTMGNSSVTYWKYFGGPELAMQDGGEYGNDIALEMTPVSSIAGISDNGGNNSQTQVIPVEKYGTIYSPAGYKVEGYARSYIIDGGPVAYVRQDLTDGWHIKAVNMYSTDAAEWYELYDADDGDYYGWVSNHHISFY